MKKTTKKRPTRREVAERKSSETAAAMIQRLDAETRALIANVQSEHHTHRTLWRAWDEGPINAFATAGVGVLRAGDQAFLAQSIVDAKAKLEAAYRDRLTRMPAIRPGMRIHDDMGQAGGIVIAVDEATVLYYNDTNENGGWCLSLTNVSDTALMEDVPALDRVAWHKLIDPVMPMAAIENATRDADQAGQTLADDFADGKSVDCDGRRIKLYDRVLVIDSDYSAIVVAIVADTLLAISEGGTVEGLSRGSALFEHCRSVRVLHNLGNGKFYVSDLIEDAA